ncbi:hypothetical protein [Micromonospora sp. SH-82]|uniref:hypothetical protein n=1 Tax=Micromonospora sp. SH-82 TaxID=3132938 RepID=UPI003EBFB783
MLDGLDDVEWDRLGHAYGSAADVPDQIRALRSFDPKVREKALEALFGNIFHQGSRYQASAYAVPFLLELLAAEDTPEPDWVSSLLTSLAIGYDEGHLPDGFPVDDLRRSAEGGRELLAAKPPPGDEGEYLEYRYLESLDGADQNRFWEYVSLAVYDAVREGVPLFRRLLDHPDPQLRIGAAYALAWFPQDAADSLAALVRVTTPQPSTTRFVRSPVEVATAVVAAGLLGAAPDPGLLTDPRPVVRWAAAVGRARVLGEHCDAATVDELLRWTTPQPGADPQAGAGPQAGADPETGADPQAGAGSEGADGGDEEVPFLDGDLGGYAALALRQCGPQHADRAFDALLDRLPTVTGTEALPVATEALRMAFPQGPLAAGTPAAGLPPRQRRLVETLAAAEGTWLFGDRTFGNFSMLVGEYGLPRNRDAMRAYLDDVAEPV